MATVTEPMDIQTRVDDAVRPILMKGNEAMAEAAIQAGCDAYFGYPITPQAELLEWMARRMPELGRVFVQAESELGAINMALGAAATGARVLVSSSSPGISLMAEGMSYLAGSELPVVLIDVMRGGPGLGSIGPSQSDYFQATKGHGHGDYRVPVLAPSSIAEAVELTADAFEIAERYRTPVMILADGVMGQAMEPVVPVYRLPARTTDGWALSGAVDRPPRVVRSLHLRTEDLEAHNRRLQAKFGVIAEHETRWAGERLEDAEVVVVAYGTSARVARTAIERARDQPLAIPVPGSVGDRPGPARHRRRGDVGRSIDRGCAPGGGRSHAGLLPRSDRRHGADAGRCGPRLVSSVGVDPADRAGHEGGRGGVRRA
jgi:2-oxoglutarate ferredoxin oxidoreductase subunit alpha